MKIIKTFLIFTFVFTAMILFGKSTGSNQNSGIYTQLNSIKSQSLSKSEKAGLLLMREEEKLARDVYQFLYKKHNLKIFSNISRSEQTHMDAVKYLLDRYKIKDPVKNDIAGKFDDKKLQKLYDDLTIKGEKSLLDALIIGATIEDLDIYDLQELLKKNDNKDIEVVYNNLLKGSRNHIRSFNRQIRSNGGKYSPVYISKDDFEKIINSSMERGAI